MLKNYVSGFLMASLLVFGVVAYAEESELTPVGRWQTIDEETKKPKSIVHVWENERKLYGKLEKVFFYSKENPNGLCNKCTGENQNKPIEGMTVIWDMQKDSQNALKWAGGQILDPKSGKTYHCQITLSGDANTLKVHGYVGVPLLGRTQTWTRIAEEE